MAGTLTSPDRFTTIGEAKIGLPTEFTKDELFNIESMKIDGRHRWKTPQSSSSPICSSELMPVVVPRPIYSSELMLVLVPGANRRGRILRRFDLQLREDLDGATANI